MRTKANRDARRRARWRKAKRSMLANVYHGSIYVERARTGPPGPAWRDVMRWIREGKVEAFVVKVDLFFGTGARMLDVSLPRDPRSMWSRKQYPKACACKVCERGGRNVRR